MTQLHKNIHKPCCEEFHVGPIFFLPNYIHCRTMIKGLDTTFGLVRCIFVGEDLGDLTMCSDPFLCIMTPYVLLFDVPVKEMLN